MAKILFLTDSPVTRAINTDTVVQTATTHLEVLFLGDLLKDNYIVNQLRGKRYTTLMMPEKFRSMEIVNADLYHKLLRTIQFDTKRLYYYADND